MSKPTDDKTVYATLDVTTTKNNNNAEERIETSRDDKPEVIYSEVVRAPPDAKAKSEDAKVPKKKTLPFACGLCTRKVKPAPRPIEQRKQMFSKSVKD